jgi:phosphatidate cytidylyltransferase
MILRILTAAILIPFVLLAIFAFPLPVFLLVVDLVIVFSLREFGALMAASSSGLPTLVYVPCLVFPWILAYCPQFAVPFVIAAVLLLLSWCITLGRQDGGGLFAAGGSVLAFTYLGFPIALIASYHPSSSLSAMEPNRAYELTLVLAFIWTSDAGAYFTGRLFGRHSITPRISPHKTAEGYVAALVFPLLVAVSVGSHLVPDKSSWFLVMASLTVAVFGVLGDLFESQLKRGARIKDTSKLIPGHGGILDRIDSLLFAFPAYHLLTFLLE